MFDTYTFFDFIDDASFLHYVKFAQNDPENPWHIWIKTDPANIQDFIQAKNYVITFLSAFPIVADGHLAEDVFNDVKRSIHVIESKQAKVKALKAAIISIAASVCLFVAGFWYYNSRITVVTPYGTQQLVSLPDSSTVLLNANSTLTYYRAWHFHPQREVWLNGEGYFKVNHLNRQPDHVKTSERFVTHLKNLNIEVLGTTYNVRQRHNETTISLISGKISVSQTNGIRQPAINLNQGQAVYFNQKLLKVIPIAKLNNEPIAWTSKKIKASGMTVQEIIESYHDTYGGIILLGNPSLLQKKIDGTISLKSPESIVFMLANLLNARIDQRRDTILLNSK